MLSTLLTLALSSCGQAEAPPRFLALSADRPVLEKPAFAGPLLAVSEEFTVTIGGATPGRVPGGDLLEVRREGSTLPAGPMPPFVMLSSGDRIPLAQPLEVRLDDERLHLALAEPLRPVVGKGLTLPQATIAAVCLAWPAGVDEVERLFPPEDRRRAEDAVILRNGDRLVGTLARFDAERCAIVQGERTTEMTLDRVAVVVFNPDLQARPRPKKAFAQAVLRSGARIRFETLQLEEGVLQGKMPLGGRLSVPLAELVRLQMRMGRSVYLDELKPLAYESVPFLDLAWPLAVNRTLLGRSLRLDGDVHDHGLAMHSRSHVTYALDGNYRGFTARVGIDPQAGPRGSVRIGVEVDGMAAASHLCQAGAPAIALNVDVRGGKRLTLVTDFGPLGDVQGHTLWTDSRLIKERGD